MKILWVTNTMFPDLAVALGQKSPVVGGWMYGLAKDLSLTENTNLVVATAKNAIIDQKETVNDITYYLLKASKPINLYDVNLESKWEKIIDEIKPDLVHIHGTEYAHGLALMRACPTLKYVISIQGLVSVYSKYYLAGISVLDIIKNLTFKDILKRESIFQGAKEFKKRGASIEVPYIKLSHNVIGRTQWDYSHAKTINPDITYHFCNESLRDVFYTSKKWEFKKDRHPSIFLSQASKPLKGLHMVLKAIFLLKKEFPDIQIRIAGGNIVANKNLKQKLKLTGYGKFIKNQIKKYGLEKQVTFVGLLNEEEMVKEYTSASMFICPSSIENSPNSLGEAQLLGVPTISAIVGGVMDMVIHEKTGLLYRFEEVEMLAQSIKKILIDERLVKKISVNAYKEAAHRHDRQLNLNTLLYIYKEIIALNNKCIYE